MAEPFGIFAGAVGIATAFSACMDCYEYIEQIREFDEDTQVAMTHLSAAGLQLMLWGKGVNIWKDPELGQLDASPEARRTVKNLLNQIEKNFDKAKKILRKYDVVAEVQDGLLHVDEDSRFVFRDKKAKRKKGPSLLKRSRWSLEHKRKLDKLVRNINQFLDRLVHLFPASPLQAEEAESDAESIQIDIETDNESLSPGLEADTESMQTKVGDGSESQLIEVESGSKVENGSEYSQIKPGNGSESLRNKTESGSGYSQNKVKTSTESSESEQPQVEVLLREMLEGRQQWLNERAQGLVETWLDLVDFNKQYDVRDQLHTQLLNQRPGTCDWIFQRPEYLSWVSDDFSIEAPVPKILWIKAPQGTGKTVLCSSILNQLQTKRRALAFFFSTDYARGNVNLNFIIRSWIAQLAQVDPSIRESVLTIWSDAQRNESAGTRASNTEIWSMFRALLLRNREVTLVIDGFDEFTRVEEQKSMSSSSTQFLRDLKEFIRGSATRLLVLSRDEYSIRTELSPSAEHSSNETLIELKISAEDVSNDIRIYARYVVDKTLTSQPEALRERLSSTAAEKCAGTFQWITCLEWELDDFKRPKQLEELVIKLPLGLREIYLNDLAKVKSDPTQRDRAFAIFRWATLAKRPLTSWELAQSLLIESDDEGIHLLLEEWPASITEAYIRKCITGICGSMIIVESRKANDDEVLPGLRTVHPIHPSISDFLLSELREYPRTASDPLASVGRSATQDDQHGYLAMVCLAFLNNDDVWNRSGDAAIPEDAPAFLDYATQNWHFHMSHVRSDDVLPFKMLSKFLKADNKHFTNWAQFYEFLHPPSLQRNIGTPLYYATVFGLVPAMRGILEQSKSQLNAVGGAFGTPLQAACAMNLEQPFHLLAKWGAVSKFSF